MGSGSRLVGFEKELVGILFVFCGEFVGQEAGVKLMFYLLLSVIS